ncbi:WSC domain-containing protein [Fusarium redolens]|uniref:WSC domain-containing protein n=1 Tax=Fusarium redolens TaxID=48865 RepID=A0A9P9KWM7_FUSRE|nr:WSC domain-containing protein [Fusarium redolens]KAH7270135.1 WSC domain-containing protein [Fusarium redolens]
MVNVSRTAAILLSTVTFCKSQETSASSETGPSIYRASGQYKYYGCYNETMQIQDSAQERALTGGSHLVKAGKMTVPICLEFCASNGTQYQYAGLEWSRECWCAPYLSSLSVQLGDGDCENSCEGNSSQVCGGPLRLSVYELSKGGDAPDGVAIQQIPRALLVLTIISGMSLLAV